MNKSNSSGHRTLKETAHAYTQHHTDTFFGYCLSIRTESFVMDSLRTRTLDVPQYLLNVTNAIHIQRTEKQVRAIQTFGTENSLYSRIETVIKSFSHKLSNRNRENFT